MTNRHFDCGGKIKTWPKREPRKYTDVLGSMLRLMQMSKRRQKGHFLFLEIHNVQKEIFNPNHIVLLPPACTYGLAKPVPSANNPASSMKGSMDE